ncbi:galactose oxidase [Westerdykella ornata]|uniref:Galactose oxidase n=1 Tax=Westerdykella ornata TaxID=318751 RepID=A0A6A6JM67_WESOR|nr:galactose oxidase [Westerdykella ornata]KAF2277760.1 galactose oxidase [Westerdykella ornata]
MSLPASRLTGTWTRLLTSDRLKRSSQVVSAIGQSVCIFGGELLPRQPIDNKVDVVTLSSDDPLHETKEHSSAPPPRVGSASACLSDRMYLFSGRGGTDMAPIDEEGAVWNYDPVEAQWYKIDPADKYIPYPPARSYHCATSDGQTTLYIHAGCPEKGRLSDLWKFDLFSRSWLRLPDAPAPPRGGASLTYRSGKLYRMNGFDGTREQGGSLDIYDLDECIWTSEKFEADGKSGPEPRSVCALLSITVQGKDKLVTLFGERDPSSLGHAGAGKMLGDVWLYDIEEKRWEQLDTSGSEATPAPRGWFAADVVRTQKGEEGIVVHGGLNENNERLGDVWLLNIAST